MSVSRAVSRLLRVSALVCAVVLSCLSMCSASPVLTQVDNGVKHSILRSLHTPHDQKPPLVAPLPPETGAQSGTHSETRTRREAWSIIDQQSNRQQFSYDENRSRSKRAGTAATRVWTDHSEGGMRPVRSLFTRRRSDRTQPRANYQPVNTNTYDYPPIIRKSSQTESGGPFYVFSQIWPPDNAPKPYDEVTYPGVFSLKTAGDEKCWIYSDLAFLPHLNGGYWTTVLRTPRGRYVGHEEANELAAGRVKSTSVPRTPPVSESWDASVIKSNPSLEKPTPSITDLTQGTNSETQTQQTSAVRGYSSVSSSLIRFQQSHRKAPSEEARQPYHDTAEPRYGAQTRTLTTHPPVTTVSSAAPAPTRLSSLPASDKALESLAPVHHAGSQDSDGPGSEQPVVGRSATQATRGSTRDHKPAQSTRRLYGFRGFENPMRRAGTEPPVPSKRYGFDNKKLNVFKTANAFSSKSPNYSLKGASTTTATQAKHEKTPTHFSPASPGSHAGIFTSGPQVWTESKTRFASRPHEGAEALVREPDKSATLQQDFEGFELRSSQFWQPRGSTTHRWYDQAGQAEQDASEISTLSQTKPGSKDFNSHLKAAVKPSRFSPDEFEMHHKSDAFLGVQPAQNPETQKTDSPAPRVSPAYLTPAGGLAVESRLKSEPESEPVAVKARPVNTPTSSIARGTRVKGKRRQTLYKSSKNTAHVAVDRLPKSPTSVAYADIVGSASFSRVGEDHFSYFTAKSRQKDNRGRPEAHAEDEEARRRRQ